MKKKNEKKKPVKKTEDSGHLKKPAYVGKYEHIFYQKYTDDDIKRIADEMYEWFNLKAESNKPKNIWLKDFAIEKMISRQRLSDFEKRSEYFAFVYGKCKELQESYLFQLGLSRSVNSGMPVFALKNVAGWRDKFPDEEPEGKTERTIKVEFV